MGPWPRIAGTLILRALDLVTIAVPPGLPACLALAMCVAMWRLGKAGIDVAAPQKLLLAGSIDTCLFDKTGTLTDSGAPPSPPPKHTHTRTRTWGCKLDMTYTLHKRVEEPTMAPRSSAVSALWDIHATSVHCIARRSDTQTAVYKWGSTQGAVLQLDDFFQCLWKK